MELRIAQSFEANCTGRKLAGYAAMFGVEARIASFTEVIRPGAFKVLPDDVLALVDHKPDQLLARTRSGTLRLEQDDKGLRYEIDVPDTRFGHDVLTLAQRGDLGGMSLGFFVPKGGERWKGELRELLAVDLREISVVHAWPAYPKTSVEARAKTPRLSLALRYMESCR